VSGSLFPTQSLSLLIEPKEEAKSFTGKHYLFLEDITRTFDATSYRKNGFKEPVSAREFAIVIDDFDANYLVKKEISKTTIEYYDFEWLDTSSISIHDFSTTFEFY